MLGLQLRQEFRSAQMPGTQIDLTQAVHASSADNILEITYPTADVRIALRALAGAAGRPVVLIGERGRGKSHILAVLHYAFRDPERVEEWAGRWAVDVRDTEFGAISLPRGFTPISVSMSDHEHPRLWDPIFKWLPDGQRYRGRFEAGGTPVPPRSLLEDAFSATPTALILDELQTWYESQLGTPVGGSPRDLAFNFIQILSELASSRPDLLRLVVAVRNSETDAYRQIHRNSPVLIDFKGADARQDRVRLTQHRLFDNYRQIDRANIERTVAAYAAERVRLLYPGAAAPEQEDARRAVADNWPFSPELVDVLEDEILMANVAQETRDLMRIFVRMYKARGEVTPLLTVADIDISDDAGGGADLARFVDTIAGSGSRLREVAQKNLQALTDQGLVLPHVREVISSLWVRSLAPGPRPGATARELHLDVTRDVEIDDNAFDDELVKLKQGSFNVHDVGDRLIFRQEENPRARLQAFARNDRYFSTGQDLTYLRNTLRHVLSPLDAATTTVSRLLVLGPTWEAQPWEGVAAEELPGAWREPVVIVLPEFCEQNRLARWLKERIAERRNLVRFLMPAQGQPNLYEDTALRALARCAYLAEDWGRSDPVYSQLRNEFQRPLREQLSQRLDRFAVLSEWDFANPARTRFIVESVKTDGAGVLKTIEEQISKDVFDPDAFRSYVLAQAGKQRSAAEIITSLTEPPASPSDTAITYLGESVLYERILQMVASGEIKVLVNGTWYERQATDSDPQIALQRIRPKAYVTGRYLQDVLVALPSAVPAQPQAPSAGTVAVTPQARTPETATASQVTYPMSGTGTINGAEKQLGEAGGESPTPRVKTFRSPGARKPINLRGDLHGWALTGKTLAVTRLQFADLPVAKLNDLLGRLPPDLLVTLEVDLEETE